METVKYPIIACVATFVVSGLLTPAVRYLAVRGGFIAAPRLDRWHKRPTAMLGGIAIFLSTLIGYLIFVPKTSDSIVIFAAAAWLFLVGLIDDFLSIKPYQKLFGQIVGAVIVTGFGLTLPLTGNQIRYLDNAFLDCWDYKRNQPSRQYGRARSRDCGDCSDFARLRVFRRRAIQRAAFCLGFYRRFSRFFTL